MQMKATCQEGKSTCPSPDNQTALFSSPGMKFTDMQRATTVNEP